MSRQIAKGTAIHEAIEALLTIRDLTTPGATSCEYQGEALIDEIRAVATRATTPASDAPPPVTATSGQKRTAAPSETGPAKHAFAPPSDHLIRHVPISRESKLKELALVTLRELEEDTEWSADTLDVIANEAVQLGLAYHGDDTMFHQTGD
jgi:hypothetical protein